MIRSTINSLDDIKVFKLYFKINYKQKYNCIKAEDIDFRFTPFDHKEVKTKKRLLFSIKTAKPSLGVEFEIVVGYEYSFFKEQSTEGEVTAGITAIIPQIISFIRGILFMISNCTPRPVILPIINVIESIREKEKELSKKISNKKIKKATIQKKKN